MFNPLQLGLCLLCLSGSLEFIFPEVPANSLAWATTGITRHIFTRAPCLLLSRWWREMVMKEGWRALQLRSWQLYSVLSRKWDAHLRKLKLIRDTCSQLRVWVDFGLSQAGASILISSLHICVSSDKLSNLFEPQFSHLYREDNNDPYLLELIISIQLDNTGKCPTWSLVYTNILKC